MQLEAAWQMVFVAAATSQRGDPDLTFFGAAAECFASAVAMRVTNQIQSLVMARQLLATSST